MLKNHKNNCNDLQKRVLLSSFEKKNSTKNLTHTKKGGQVAKKMIIRYTNCKE